MGQLALDFDGGRPARPRRERGTIGERFAAFLASEEGAEIAREFLRIALRLKAAGRRHYGAKSIVEVIRYHRDIAGDGINGFKIDNRFTSRLARWAVESQPDLEGLFEMRELRAE